MNFHEFISRLFLLFFVWFVQFISVFLSYYFRLRCNDIETNASYLIVSITMLFLSFHVGRIILMTKRWNFEVDRVKCFFLQSTTDAWKPLKQYNSYDLYKICTMYIHTLYINCYNFNCIKGNCTFRRNIYIKACKVSKYLQWVWSDHFEITARYLSLTSWFNRQRPWPRFYSPSEYLHKERLSEMTVVEDRYIDASNCPVVPFNFSTARQYQVT